VKLVFGPRCDLAELGVVVGILCYVVKFCQT
jgi:hypothetical protein